MIEEFSLLHIYEKLSEKSPFPPPPWGKIYKGTEITESFTEDAEKIANKRKLEEPYTWSVAVGVMEPGAFHKPYIRHVPETEGKDHNKGLRVYKILSGSMIFVKEGNLKEFFPSQEYVFVEDLDIFSFKSGEKGCVFAIFDFPAFDPSYDTNEVF